MDVRTRVDARRRGPRRTCYLGLDAMVVLLSFDLVNCRTYRTCTLGTRMHHPPLPFLFAPDASQWRSQGLALQDLWAPKCPAELLLSEVCSVCGMLCSYASFSKLAHDVHVLSYRPRMESYLSASTMYVQCAVSTPSRSPGTGTPSVSLARLPLPLTTFASFATLFHPPRLCLYLLCHQETRKCVSSTSLRATGHLRRLNLRNSSERSRQTLSSSQSE